VLNWPYASAKARRASGGVVAVVLLSLAAVGLHFHPGADASPAALSKPYTNAAYGFTLKMPADFSAYPPNATPNRDEIGAPTGQAIVLQNKSGAIVQIEITPDSRAESSDVLTADDMEQLAPVYDLSEAQPIQMAPGVVGVTFTDTKYPSFGTATEQVWFAYRGNLYTVTADAKNAALFKSMMTTWTFI
jgi:hypothetical protein